MFNATDFNGNIQQAIDVAHDLGGGTVYVPGGTVWEQALTLRSHVKLLGAGTISAAAGGLSKLITVEAGAIDWSIAGLQIDGTGLVLGDDGHAYCIFEASGSLSQGGTIDGLSFRNIPLGLGQVTHAVELNAQTARIVNCRVDGSGGDAIAINVGSYFVAGNFVSGSADGGIAANNCASGYIGGNTLRQCDLGIGSGAAGTTSDPYSSLEIVGNKIDACGDGINMGWFGLTGRTAPQHVKIVGNVVQRAKRTGIRYDGSVAGFAGGLSIVGNSIMQGGATDYDGTAGAGDGLILSSVDEVALSGNIITDNLGKGLSCPSPVQHVALGANVIRRNAVGIDFTNTANWAGDVGVVSSNTTDFIGSMA